MKDTTNALVPEQQVGMQKNTSETVEFENWEAAQQFFQVARKRLLDRAASERMAVIGYHFPMPATGRVKSRSSISTAVAASASPPS